MVPLSSSGPVAPLNVRKRSNGSQTSSVEPARHPAIKHSKETLKSKHNVDLSGLTSIGEDTTLLNSTVVRKKRSGWFGRSKKDAEVQQGQPQAQETATEKASAEQPAGSPQSSEFPIRKSRLGGGKKGFSKWIGRMGREKGIDTTVTEAGKCLRVQDCVMEHDLLTPHRHYHDDPPLARLTILILVTVTFEQR